ncbi:hypothetical protein SteCoe_36481 [Stentor coeruleus]|uniref:Uncharacterized protein n=1 Tax=Stentor coeruleus TaxID=5963 RepID=A0A1R2AQ11_9CILI|nr:hypothetical protein SteCoe_36481 [Stentor coeruleus]
MSWIDLVMICPVDGCPNKNEMTWLHYNCREKMEINELAQLRCKAHRIESDIFSWRFDCGNPVFHNGHSSFHKPDRNKLLSVLACSLRFNELGADDDWIDNLILNLRKKNR